MNSILQIPDHIFSGVYALGNEVGVMEVRRDNREYLHWITSQSCFGCSTRKGHPVRRGKIDAHHIETKGLSRKCWDEWTVPLCHSGCHLGGVHAGEKSFLAELGLGDDMTMRRVALTYMAYYVDGHREDWDTEGSNARRVAFRFVLLANQTYHPEELHEQVQ
jgi:hypothetical protein